MNNSYGISSIQKMMRRVVVVTQVSHKQTYFPEIIFRRSRLRYIH